jgi:hypothetical protein
MARLHEDRCPVQREIFTQSLDGYVVLFVTIETLAHPFPNRIILTHKIIRTGSLAPRRPIRALASETSWPSDGDQINLQPSDSKPGSKCCEHVASHCEQCCEQIASRLRATSKYQRTSSLLLSCCDHVATMLRACCNPCCVQHPTSGALLPSSSLTQHPTLHVCNIKTQHPQHLLNHCERESNQTAHPKP